MRVFGWQTLMRNESEKVGSVRCTIDRARLLLPRREYEHTCWDPKDGELYLNRVKPEETLVEARSGSDVQIDRQIWV
jgi:hypothetical protein